MKENIEQDMAILAKLQNQKNAENELKAWDQNDQYFKENEENLKLILNATAQIKFSENALKQIKNKKLKTKISYFKTGMAAGVALFLSLGYLVFDKNFFSDLIITENVLRSDSGQPESDNPQPQKQAYMDFLDGKASYHAKEYNRAISFYKKALEVNDLRNQFREAIEWHLCVAYLLDNQIDDCKKLLFKIENNPNPKYEINSVDLLKLKTQLWLKK